MFYTANIASICRLNRPAFRDAIPKWGSSGSQNAHSRPSSPILTMCKSFGGYPVVFRGPVTGLISVLSFSFAGLPLVMAILAIAAGVLILFGR